VRLIRLEEGDSIASVAKVEEEKEPVGETNVGAENIPSDVQPENNPDARAEDIGGETPETPTDPE
jgi:hypothetical protein